MYQYMYRYMTKCTHRFWAEMALTPEVQGIHLLWSERCGLVLNLVKLRAGNQH